MHPPGRRPTETFGKPLLKIGVVPAVIHYRSEAPLDRVGASLRLDSSAPEQAAVRSLSGGAKAVSQMQRALQRLYDTKSRDAAAASPEPQHDDGDDDDDDDDGDIGSDGEDADADAAEPEPEAGGGRAWITLYQGPAMRCNTPTLRAGAYELRTLARPLPRTLSRAPVCAAPTLKMPQANPRATLALRFKSSLL